MLIARNRLISLFSVEKIVIDYQKVNLFLIYYEVANICHTINESIAFSGFNPEMIKCQVRRCGTFNSGTRIVIISVRFSNLFSLIMLFFEFVNNC